MDNELRMNLNAQSEDRHVDTCKCKVETGKGRNLVLCIDGTSNQFGRKNTNVIELYSQLRKDSCQITYYNSGIGTYAKPSWVSFSHWKQVLDNKIDLAIAWDFEKIVMKAYRWLSDKYQNGDRIYLFGFSRGAYQVRVIAGMIDKVGLIHEGNEEQIPFAYELYLDPTSGVSSGRSESGFFRRFLNHDPKIAESDSSNLAERFKKAFSRSDVRVHFIGAWDTVSSIGIIKSKNLPGTDSPDHTCYFRHALALDERRVKFLPEYARGGVMLKEQEEDKFQDFSRQAVSPHVKEVWFPGTHSDIGGGNVVNSNLDRRHPAFLWMCYEATSAGLVLDPSNVEWKWEELGEVHESLTSIWRPFEYLPVKRLSNQNAEAYTWRPHCGRGRKIQPGQKVHASVAFCKSDYYPKALLRHDYKKRNLRTLVACGKTSDNRWTRGWEDLLEMDIFDLSTAEVVIKKIEEELSKDPKVWVHRLTVMSWSSEGCSTLRRVEQVASRLVSVMHKTTDVSVAWAIGNAVAEFAVDAELGLLVEMYQQQADIVDAKSPLIQFMCNGKTTVAKRNVIRILIKNDDLRQKISENFTSVLLLLQEKGHHVQSGSVVIVVAELAKYDDLRLKMLESNIITILLAMVAEDDEDARRSVCEAVTELAKYDDSRSTISEFNIRDFLVLLNNKDQSVRHAITTAITELAKHEDSYRKLLKHNIVAELSPFLKDEFWMVRQSVVYAMTELAKHDDSRSEVQSDIIIKMFYLLLDQSWRVRQSAVSAVAELAKHDDSRFKILELNIVNRIPQMLRDLEDDVRNSAEDVVQELAKHEDSRQAMEELGVGSQY